MGSKASHQGGNGSLVLLIYKNIYPSRACILALLQLRLKAPGIAMNASEITRKQKNK